MRDGAVAQPGPAWLRDHSPGYFALVMGTGIVAVAARLLGHPAVAWPLFAITLSAYPVLWAILLARIVIFPRAVVADFVSHERGSTFLTIVAANGVLVANLPRSMSRGPAAAAVLVQHRAVGIAGIRFPRRGDRNTAKPDLAHGLNGSWLLLVVATESLAVLGSFPALRSGEAPALVFASLAFYLFGAMLYVLLSALIFFRWMFRPMRPAEMSAPWWINMGAVAIATLAGARLMALPGTDPYLLLLQHFVNPFTVLLGPPAHSGYRCW